MTWKLHHKVLTASTNLDARAGVPGDVFTADEQTAGRGRLDHAWQSAPGANLTMSAVLDVAGLPPEHVATLPLVAGLAVREVTGGLIKWPNDVLINGRKVCGILCERVGDCVIAGIGVNVRQTEFPEEIRGRATSLQLERPTEKLTVEGVRDGVLAALGRLYETWRAGGLAALYPRLAACDALKGKELSVRRTDDDANPVRGICGGILPDGALDVGGAAIYAGEAHVGSW